MRVDRIEREREGFAEFGRAVRGEQWFEACLLHPGVTLGIAVFRQDGQDFFRIDRIGKSLVFGLSIPKKSCSS